MPTDVHRVDIHSSYAWKVDYGVISAIPFCFWILFSFLCLCIIMLIEQILPKYLLNEQMNHILLAIRKNIYNK